MTMPVDWRNDCNGYFEDGHLIYVLDIESDGEELVMVDGTDHKWTYVLLHDDYDGDGVRHYGCGTCEETYTVGHAPTCRYLRVLTQYLADVKGMDG
jgi:hypothetical protein